jgi:hypothetical protein
VEGGGAPGGGSAREPAAAAPAGQSGEEDDQAGRAGWAGRRPRPSGGLVVAAQKREGRVGRPGWKERRAVAGPNPESGQNSKEILFEFQLIL